MRRVEQTSATLVDALRRAQRLDRGGLVFVGLDLEAHELGWAEIAARSERRAVYLQRHGVAAGDRVGLMAADDEDFVLAFFGLLLARAVPVPMFPPLPFARLDAQVSRAAAVLKAADARVLIAPRALENVIARLRGAAPGLELVTWTEELARAPEVDVGAAGASKAEPSDLCFLQFTSGSTAEPKGVMVSHANAVANVEALHRSLRSDGERDIGLSWVPLYHDMGLIGSVVTPLLSHGRHVYLPSMLFATRPWSWLELAHRYRATMLSTNNYGLRAATKRLPKIAGLDLSCIRVISVGAEPIYPATVRHFMETFAPYGLDPRALGPAYGMAESTLAISCSDPREPFRTLAIDPEECSKRGKVVRSTAPDAREVVSCGRVLPDHELAIVDEAGQPLEADRVGEIVVRGPSVTSGYFRSPEATAALFAGSWMRTGDLGFLDEGELYVLGRRKDLIIIGGRNYDPQVIEWAAAAVPGVRPHHAIAFSVPDEDTEALILVVECKHPQRTEGLEQAIRAAVRADTGLDPREVLIVPPFFLPKTSSGKPQRSSARDAYQRGLIRGLHAYGSKDNNHDS